MTLKQLSDLDHAEACNKTTMRPDYIPKTKFSDKNANELEKSIVRFIQLHNGQAERIKNMGRVLPAKRVKSHSGNTITLGKDTYIPSSGTSGTSDLAATIPVMIGSHKIGLKVSIEIKFGTDRPSPAQLKYAEDIINAGGVHWFIKTWEQFILEYNNLIAKYK